MASNIRVGIYKVPDDEVEREIEFRRSFHLHGAEKKEVTKHIKKY